MSKSNREKILQLLKKGEVLTRKSIDHRIGTLKGPTRISELRDEGYDIRDRRIRTIEGRRPKAYFIPDALDTNLCYCSNCEDLSKSVSEDHRFCFECNEELEVVVAKDEAA